MNGEMQEQFNNNGYAWQRGIALVVVLWMLVFLTIMAAGYSTTMRTETRLTALQLHAAQSRALAEAGVWLAVTELLKPEPERIWPVDGMVNEIDFPDGVIEIIIQDQTGKIDINTADGELLRGLFLSVGVDDNTSLQITNAILDWRDRDDLTRVNGAEDPEYRQAGSRHEAKDGPFNSLEESRLLLGMTEEIFQQIRPALTIYSHLPGINTSVAPRESLLAIPGTDPDSIDEYIQSRSDPANQNVTPAAPLLNSRLTNRTRGISFMIASTGIVNETKVTLEVVISLRRTSELPYTVLAWREI